MAPDAGYGAPRAEQGVGVRVLVVDDDPVIAELLELNLGLEGHATLRAADGHEALAAVRADPRPDAVVLDVMMPGLDGITVCERLRSDPVTADLPVVLLSAGSQDTDRLRGTAAGADDYVTKPFDPIALVRLLEALVARH